MHYNIKDEVNFQELNTLFLDPLWRQPSNSQAGSPSHPEYAPAC
jgi:hypothetical protein